MEKSEIKFKSAAPANVLAILGGIPSSVVSDWEVHLEQVEMPDGSMKTKSAVFYIHNDEKGIHREVHLCYLDAGHGDQFVTVVYWEAGGGGTVAMPYVMFEGELYVALAFQNRPCMGGMSWNAAGGYNKITAPHKDAGLEELAAEVGRHDKAFLNTWMVPGPRMNPQRSQWFSDFRKGEGIGCLAVEVDVQFLECTDRGTLKLSVNMTRDHNAADTEVIEGVEFFPYSMAVMMCPDMMVPAWAARIKECVNDPNIEKKMNDGYSWMLD